MLKRVDRVQIAVADLSRAEKIAAAVFGAEALRRDQVAPLCARRATMQAGTSLLVFGFAAHDLFVWHG